MFSKSLLWKIISFPRFSLSRSMVLIERNFTAFSSNSYSSSKNSEGPHFQKNTKFQPFRRFTKNTTSGRKLCPFGFPVGIGSSFFPLAVAYCQCKNKDKCEKCGKFDSCCICGNPSKQSEDKNNCCACECCPPANYQWSSQTPICWEPDDLTHCFLMKQANTVAVDSITRILTETLNAIDDYHTQYRHLIEVLMDLMEESRCSTDHRLELIECKMIVARSSIEDMKRNIIELECYLESVSRLAHAAAETSFLANAEHASIALMERLNSVNTQVTCIKEKTKDLERSSTELQSLIIVESGRGLK